MKNLVITGGNFSANGNFNGYTITGEEGRIHITGAQMKSRGWTKDEDVKFPFFATVIEREFNKRDAEGNLTTETFKRLQASAVFTDKATAIAAHVESKKFQMEITRAIAKAEASLDLEESLEESLESTVA